MVPRGIKTGVDRCLVLWLNGLIGKTLSLSGSVCDNSGGGHILAAVRLTALFN